MKRTLTNALSCQREKVGIPHKGYQIQDFLQISRSGNPDLYFTFKTLILYESNFVEIFQKTIESVFRR